MRYLLAVLTAVLAGCGAGQVQSGRADDGARASALGDASPLTGQVAQALVSANLATASEAANLLHLRGEAGFEVFSAPAIPGPSDRVLFVALMPKDFPQSALSTSAHFTADGWSTFADVAGTTFAVGDRFASVFDLGTAASGTELRATFRFYAPSFPQPIWLNGEGQDYRAKVAAPARLQWAGQARFEQDGLGRSLPNDVLFAGHALTVHVQSYPETPGVQAIVHWTADDFANIHDAPMSVEAIHAGSSGHDTAWRGVLPTSTLSAGSKITWWIELRGPLNTVWDSNGGQNYAGFVSPAPQPSWAEVGVYSFTKGHSMPDGSYQAGWFYNSGLRDPLTATPDDFQTYGWSPYPAVELYVPGVTDRADAASAAQGGFIRVEVFSPFFSSSPSATWTGHALDFRETDGNNLRFAWSIVDRNAGHDAALGAACPVDGSYGYKFRISTDGGQSWQWLGLGGLPSGGGDRTMQYAALRYAPPMSTSGTTAFGRVQKTHSKTIHFDVVNTSSHTVQLTGATKDGASAVTATITGCSAFASCSKTLAPGARFTVNAKFKPTTATDYAANFHFAVSDVTDPCYVSGNVDVAVSGTGY